MRIAVSVPAAKADEGEPICGVFSLVFAYSDTLHLRQTADGWMIHPAGDLFYIENSLLQQRISLPAAATAYCHQKPPIMRICAESAAFFLFFRIQ